MICPNCKKAMMPRKRMDEVYYFCTNCGCEIESTSNSDDTKINMTDNTPNTCGHECCWCDKNKREEQGDWVVRDKEPL